MLVFCHGAPAFVSVHSNLFVHGAGAYRRADLGAGMTEDKLTPPTPRERYPIPARQCFGDLETWKKLSDDTKYEMLRAWQKKGRIIGLEEYFP